MILVFKYILMFVEVTCSLLLIGVILMQRSKGQGAGAAFGGGMGEAVFGSQMGNVLTKSTVVLTFVFLVNTTLLAIIGSQSRRASVTDALPSTAGVAPISAPFAPPGSGGPPPPVAPLAPAPLAVPDGGFGAVDVGSPVGSSDIPSESAPSVAPPEGVPSAPVVPAGDIQPVDIGDPLPATE